VLRKTNNLLSVNLIFLEDDRLYSEAELLVDGRKPGLFAEVVEA